MVVLVDGVDLRVGADFREFFLLFFLLLFLLAGIGALETSIVNFVDVQHRFHRALGAGGIREEGSDLQHGYSWAGEIISGRARRRTCAVVLRAKSKSPPCRKSRQGRGTLWYFPLDGFGIRE